MMAEVVTLISYPGLFEVIDVLTGLNPICPWELSE